jgi:hypothetical protein
MNKLRNAQLEDELLDGDPEVEAAPVPDSKDLKQLALLAHRHIVLESEIAALENQIAAKKEALKALREVDIPTAMTEVRMESFKLEGGGTVELKKLTFASITDANKPAAFAALEKNGHGAIIKHEIKILFGKGEEAWAKKFLADLAKRKRPLNTKRRDFIEPQTLGKLARELVEGATAQGLDPKEALPDNLFTLLSIYQARFAEVSLPEPKV